MLDLNFVRNHPEEVKRALAKLNTTAPVDELLAVDERRRQLVAEVEALRAERNRVSKDIGRIRDESERETKKAEMRRVGDQISGLEEELRVVETRLRELQLLIPNLPDPEVPVGPDETHNVIVRQEGELRHFDFDPLPHWEIGPKLDILDLERGVKLSGTRFFVLKKAGARLQRALITWMLDLHINRHGYSEIAPPYLVHGYCIEGVTSLAKFGDTLYHDVEEDLWLIPTAEVPVTNLYRDEILDGAQLPIYHVAFTPCWRRERMSAGRDVRGIKRVHQFDKVEMVKFVRPETSNEELMTLIDNAEDVCRGLEIPHRVIEMCTGDLAFSAARKFDVEMWAPGSGEWLEVSSCSNFRDFQARRANIRFRPAPGAKAEYVHTLNGSGLALPRVIITVLENYQQADGSIVIPEVLRPYMGGMEVIEP